MSNSSSYNSREQGSLQANLLKSQDETTPVISDEDNPTRTVKRR